MIQHGVNKTEWVAGFSDELRKLRPHLSLKVAWTIGVMEWVKHQADDPVATAKRWHKETRPPKP